MVVSFNKPKPASVNLRNTVNVPLTRSTVKPKISTLSRSSLHSTSSPFAVKSKVVPPRPPPRKSTSGAPLSQAGLPLKSIKEVPPVPPRRKPTAAPTPNIIHELKAREKTSSNYKRLSATPVFRGFHAM